LLIPHKWISHFTASLWTMLSRDKFQNQFPTKPDL
jgi:hypothetical protein